MTALLLAVCVVCAGGDRPDDLDRILRDAPRADDLPTAEAVVLRSERDFEVDETGRVTITLRWTLKVLRPGGVAHAGLELPWTTPTQSLTVVRARTVRADGRLVELGDLALQPLSAGRYGEVFGDVVRQQLVFPYVEPGAVVDAEVVIADNRPSMPEGFADLCVLQSTDPVKTATYRVRTPAETVFNSHVSGVLPPPIVRVQGRWTETTWRVTDLPAIVDEWQRPRDIQHSLWILVSATRTWDAVGERYRSLASSQYVAHSALREEARRLAQADDPVAAAYGYVATRIRYGLGPLESRAPGIQPRPAYETFDHRVGDCKDQATLLITLLREIGVAAFPALLRRTVNGPLVEDVPAMLQFDHVIVAVPRHGGGWRWFDPTWSYGPPDYLPPDIQGARALVLADAGMTWTELPVASAADNVHVREADDLVLGAEGYLQGEITVRGTGGFEQALRYEFRGLDANRAAQRVERALASVLPNVSVDPETVTLTPAGDLAQPFVLRYRFVSRRFAERTQRLLLVRPAAFEQARLPSELGDGPRRYPLVLAPSPERRVTRLRFRVAPELSVREIPPDRERRERFGWFCVTYRQSGGTLEYTREVQLDEVAIPAAEIDTWRSWLLDLSAADRQWVVLEWAGG